MKISVVNVLKRRISNAPYSDSTASATISEPPRIATRHSASVTRTNVSIAPEPEPARDLLLRGVGAAQARGHRQVHERVAARASSRAPRRGSRARSARPRPSRSRSRSRGSRPAAPRARPRRAGRAGSCARCTRRSAVPITAHAMLTVTSSVTVFHSSVAVRCRNRRRESVVPADLHGLHDEEHERQQQQRRDQRAPRARGRARGAPRRRRRRAQRLGRSDRRRPSSCSRGAGLAGAGRSRALPSPRSERLSAIGWSWSNGFERLGGDHAGAERVLVALAVGEDLLAVVAHEERDELLRRGLRACSTSAPRRPTRRARSRRRAARRTRSRSAMLLGADLVALAVPVVVVDQRRSATWPRLTMLVSDSLSGYEWLPAFDLMPSSHAQRRALALLLR